MRASGLAIVALMFGGGLFGGGVVAQEPRVAWKFAPEGSEFVRAVTRDGVVYALDRTGWIYALDGASGEQRWRSERKLSMSFGYGFAFSADPGFDALVVGCDDGLVALSPETGEQIWATAIGLGVAGPACTKTEVVAASADGNVYGCDLTSGKVLWKHDFFEDRSGDPPGFSGERARFDGRPARPQGAATDGRMVVFSVFDQCRTLAVDAATGKRLWAFQTKGWMHGTPVIGPRNVYVGSQDKSLYAIDREMGKLAWKKETGGRVESTVAPTERFAYFGSCDGNVYAIDQGVGRVAWTFEAKGEGDAKARIYCVPLVLEQAIYVATLGGVLHAVDRKSGKGLWALRPSEGSGINSSLAACGGSIVLTTRKKLDEKGESALVAIELPSR